MFHIVWMLCWFIAAVEWAVVQSSLAGFMNDLVTRELTSYCTVNREPKNSGYLQGSIGDVSELYLTKCMCILMFTFMY